MTASSVVLRCEKRKSYSIVLRNEKRKSYWDHQVIEDEISGVNERFLLSDVPILHEHDPQPPHRPDLTANRGEVELKQIIALTPSEHLYATICNALGLYLFEKRIREHELELKRRARKLSVLRRKH